MAKRRNLEELGYQHGSTGSRMACPTLIGNERYKRGFCAGWKATSDTSVLG